MACTYIPIGTAGDRILSASLQTELRDPAPEPARSRHRHKAGARLQRRLRRRALHAAALAALHTVGKLSVSQAGALGATLGALAWRLSRGRANLAVRQLEAMLGSSPARSRRLGCAVFENLGRSNLEALAAMRLPADGRIELCSNYEEFRALLREDLARGSGLLVVTAHLGNWELLASLVSTIAPLHVVAERPHDPALAEWLESARQRLGSRTLYTDAFARPLVRALARNELVGVLADHDLHRMQGIFVPFLGREAWTPTAPVMLAQRTGCVLRPLFLVRDGERYRFILRDAIAIPPRSAGAEGIREATLGWLRAVQEEIRARPEQWTWTHQRWRTRPPGEPLAPGERWPAS